MGRVRRGTFAGSRLVPPPVNLIPATDAAMTRGIVITVPFSLVVPSSGGPFGGPYLRFTASASQTQQDFLLFGDVGWVAGTGAQLAGALPAPPGSVYTGSFYVRSSVAAPFAAQMQYLQGGGGAAGTTTPSYTPLTPNTWTRFSATGTAGADSQALRLDVDHAPWTWAAGDTVDIACPMISAGPVLLPFSSGSRLAL